MWECELRDSAREVLILGQRRGVSQAVLSAMKQETLNEMIAHFDLRDMFTDVVGLIDHHAYGKQEIAEEWILTQRAPCARMVLIGDTAHDFDVATALGIDCWHIHSGHHSRDRLIANGVPLIGSLLDLYLPDDDD
jgi:phosphoglycolate phosphatase